MTQLAGDLDVEKGVEDYKEGGFTVRPPGWYTAVLLKDEEKITKEDKRNNVKSAVANKFLEAVFQIQDGTKDEVKELYNIKNRSKKCQAIGRANLCKVAESVGHTGTFSNTAVLFGRPLMIKLGVEEFQTNKIDPATNTLEIDPSTGKPKMLKNNIITGYAKVGSTPATTGSAPVGYDSRHPSASESKEPAPSGPEQW